MLLEAGEPFGGNCEISLRAVVEARQSSNILDGLHANPPYQQCGYQGATNNENVVVKIMVEHSCFYLQGLGGGGSSSSSSSSLGGCSLSGCHFCNGQDGHKSRHNAQMGSSPKRENANDGLASGNGCRISVKCPAVDRRFDSEAKA